MNVLAKNSRIERASSWHPLEAAFPTRLLEEIRRETGGHQDLVPYHPYEEVWDHGNLGAANELQHGLRPTARSGNKE